MSSCHPAVSDNGHVSHFPLQMPQPENLQMARGGFRLRVCCSASALCKISGQRHVQGKTQYQDRMQWNGIVGVSHLTAFSPKDKSCFSGSGTGQNSPGAVNRCLVCGEVPEFTCSRCAVSSHHAMLRQQPLPKMLNQPFLCTLEGMDTSS